MSQIGELQIPALKGADGADGEAGKILSVSLTILAVGQTPYVHNTGTEEEAVLEIGIPAIPGISNMAINASNELVITKDDGTIINAGAIDLSSIQNSINSQIQTIDGRITNEFATQNATIATKSAIADTGYKAQVVYDTNTFKISVKILNSSDTVLSTSGEVDLDVGDTVDSVTYDAVNEKFVITKKDGTTSYINKSTIVADLATSATVTALATTVASKLDTSTYTSDKNTLDSVISGIQSDILARSLITETANKIELEIDNSTYQLVAKLYDKNNNLISTSSIIDLPIESKEDSSNKVTSLSSASTNTQYPSAKLVYDQLALKENLANKVTSVDENSTDAQYPTAKCLHTINSGFETRVSLLENIESMETLTWAQIQAIVQAGQASRYFKIGDQIMTTWTDTQTSTEYEIPLDVVSFEDVVIDDNGTEKTVPGMTVQWHYCSPFGVQFCNGEAFYHCEEALEPGTYYFEFGNDWGNNVHSGYKYEFTTTVEIPAGGLICLTQGNHLAGFYMDTSASNWKVKTYSSNTDTTPLETLTLTQYTTETPSSTLLCTLRNSTKYNTTYNDIYTVGAGSNRWKTSALRQFLNSNADKDAWFTPDTTEDVFLMIPEQLSTKDGFLKGCDSDLLSVIKAVKIKTAINTTRDSEKGTFDETFDKFFIPSLEQMYINPQLSGEGAYWPYWKTRSERTSPMAQGSTYAQIITYGADNHTSAQSVRLRSAYRGNSNNTWRVGTGGNISNFNAYYASRFSPACVIC